jgi:hypothetical protein
MKKSKLLIMILFALWSTGCSDDDSDSGPGTPVPDTCADVGGTWSMVMEVQGGWFGGVFPSVAELAQSDSCTVAGTMNWGTVIEGYTTQDSFYFSYGEVDSAPEKWVYCALEIIDKYLLEGEYIGPDETGAMTMHGPDPDCSGSVEIKISAGLTPTFTWAPDCQVSFMLIELDGSDQWLVGNENANELGSGITYGVAPPGINSRDASPLVAGNSYTVVLYRWLGKDDAYLMADYTSFTP